MLTVTGLTKSFGREVILDDVTFTVNAGDRTGLTGRNGSGKTTLLKLIVGEDQADSGLISMPKGYTASYLSQHIHFTERSVLKEACANMHASDDGRDESYRVKAILSGLGFSSAQFDFDPRMLSGGYQVRLNLAKILVSEPNLLLLDEPTNYLDILSIRWLTQFLKTWKSEMILVTHARAFMDSVTTHTMGIHRKKVRKVAGDTEKFYRQIIQEEEIYEKTRINDERRHREIEQFINRFRAQATRARAVQSKIRMLEKHEKKANLVEERSLDFEFKAAPFPGKWLVEIDDLCFSFTDAAPPIIDGLKIAVKKKDRIAVVGKNGKGKTTLLKLIAGELVPQRGAIRPNQNLVPAHFGQMNVERLDPNKTVLEEILSAHQEYALASARAISGAMLFEDDKAMKKISVLSGGERSRVMLGKILARPANMILLDEPDNHLDAESIDALIEAIDEFDGAVIIVTHSEMILKAVATRLLVFDAGGLTLFEGGYADFLERVGWADERTAPAVDIEIAYEEREKVPTKKDLRKLRAQIIADKSKVLTPLKKKVTHLEQEITDLEAAIDRDNKALIAASRNGQGKDIESLSLAIYTAGIKIERLFEELDAATGEYEKKSAVFEGRLQELAGE
ncbi:MAG TPA: ATP-binding cassette domain-containing protein [Syntrophorhabdaceae bacterium]|nr:ATP-binding cassette domain-containing protein [Syntrophorhabdaceae bacterium]